MFPLIIRAPIGFPEFDKKLIIQSNNEELTTKLFADEQVRSIFQDLSGFSLKTAVHKEKNNELLEFEIQRAILDSGELHDIYNAFCSVLSSLNNGTTARDESIAETAVV